MKKMILIMMMLTTVFLTSCQTEETADSCDATLSDIMMEDSSFMGITGVTTTDAHDIPITGGTIGQQISLNEEFLVISRYTTSEAAAEQLSPAALEETFSTLGTVIEDGPILFGDETSWVQLNEGSASELAVARYGDRLLIGQAVAESSMQGMFDGFDMALLAYIDDHAECAYLHPETR